MKHYDYLIVGSGLFGATFAYKARQAGKSCLVIDKRPHLGGNVYCSPTLISSHVGRDYTINVHKYGAHIFHTSNKEDWDCPKTVISEEYSTEYKEGMEPYYPVNDERNNALANAYRKLAHQEGVMFPEDINTLPTGEGTGEDIIFGGRLAEYKYYDMAPIIEQTLKYTLYF